MISEKDIEKFLKVASSVVKAYYKEKGFSFELPEEIRGSEEAPILEVAPGGRKYAKIIRTGQSMVYCFVNKENGDILKAASWAAPAKHARGNIFDADGGKSALGPYGAKYLR